MLARFRSATVVGIDAVGVEVEVDVGRGLPGITVLGLSDVCAREGRDRVRAAVRNSGFTPTMHRVTVSLAPAALRKQGGLFDLPVALGLLAVSDALDEAACTRAQRLLFAGELALDGRLRPVRGVLALAALARRLGLDGVVVPHQNGAEAAVVGGIDAYAASSLREVVDHLNGTCELKPVVASAHGVHAGPSTVDFAEVRGQALAKRALLLAAAGEHNVLMVGPPGAGKTMLARRLPTIMRPLTDDEALEVTRIASVAGLLRDGQLVRERPFRAPHHTASEAALVGGGSVVGPGEVTLAHRGVLFLDELPEFGARKLDTLRQPLEEGSIRISRVKSTVEFPARFVCVAAMNPCSCGHYSPLVPCGCSALAVSKYAGRVSGPLRDRFDITLELSRVPVLELGFGAKSKACGPTSAQMREQVVRAHDAQLQRQGCANASLTARDLVRVATLGPAEKRLFDQLVEAQQLSARQAIRTWRLARTVADVEKSEPVLGAHLHQAVMLRRSAPAASAGAKPAQRIAS